MAHRAALSLLLLVSLTSPSFGQSPDVTRDYASGRRTTFSTKDHPKSKGVNLTIAYPASWAAAEGTGPNIVQRFVSEGGNGREVVLIVTKDLDLPPGTVFTEQELKDLFAPSALRGQLPAGATFINARSTSVQGRPAGLLEYTMRLERGGTTFLTQALTVNFLSRNTLVQVQCQVVEPAGTESEMSRRMAAFKPLFTLILNSIALPGQ